MAMTTGTGAAILSPEQVAELLVKPVFEQAVCTQVANVVSTGSTSFRIPVVNADPTASWTAEGAEITPSDAVLAEITVTPAKLAGLTIISRELANDTSPAAADVVGEGLARDLARKLDQAFWAGMASPAPAGLATLAGVTAVAAPAAWGNVDPFVTAIYAAEDVDATLTAFVTSPADAEQLSQLKEATGSNRPLLSAGGDPTQPARRQLAGVPLLVSRYVAEGDVWGIPRDRVHVVVREDSEVLTDGSVFFTSDRVAVRAIMRAGFAFPHPAAVVKITRAA